MYNSKRPKKSPSPVTPKSLQQSSMRYLRRYVPSKEQLRRVLMRRVDARHRAFPEEARDEMVVLVEREIERCIELELLNDEVFTKLWVEQLHRRGDSLFSIRSKLQKKGVSREVINSQIALFNQESSGNVGFLSAISYARRRGLGPFRRDWSTRETHKKKDIASMIRAGHSYDYVKEIVSSTDITVLLELAEENK